MPRARRHGHGAEAGSWTGASILSFRRTPRRSVAVFAVSLEKPAIKKPFGCRVAVVLQPSSRPMREDYIPCSAGPPSMRQRETAGDELEEVMATLDITDVRPDLRSNGNSFAEGRLNPTPAERWAPPLAPNETTTVPNGLLREDTFHPVVGGEEFYPVIGGEDAFQPVALSNPSQTFLSRRNLIAGTAVIVALGVAGLAYFFLASPAAKVPAEASATAVQSSEPSSPRAESSSATPVQPATTVTVAEPSRGASDAVSSPDVAASLNPDVVFLQRPGVNIRSAPSGNAPVLGTAPRGTQFTASSREGDWVQVENTRLKGWINSQFLSPNKPQ